MKKKIVILFLAVICLLGTMGAMPVFASEDPDTEVPPPATQVPDRPEPGSDARLLSVMGCGKVCAAPDAMEISFGMQLRAKSLAEGQKALSETFQKVVNAIQAVDPDAAASAMNDYSCAYPVCESGLSSYELTRNFRIKSRKLDQLDQLIAAAADAGSVRFHGTQYLLENQSDACMQALTAARENALAKAAALYPNAVLRELCEVGVYCYATPDAAGCITVEASVRACFEA